MKVIIAGSRSYDSWQHLLLVVGDAVNKSRFNVTEILSGGARGVDRAGERYGDAYGIPVRRYDPKWNQLGRGAGMVRNSEMTADADALIVLWDGESKGTLDTIKKAQKKGIPIYYHFSQPEKMVAQLSLF